MTRDAFENAMVLVTVLGGSTNAVLHLIAMARSVGVSLTLDDFQRVSDRVPLLADFKPSGSFVMEDLHAVGGIPAVIKMLLDAGLVNGDCLTVTGKTLEENLAPLPGLTVGQPIVRPVSDPIKASGHFRSCAATSRRRVPSPRSPARKGCSSPVPRKRLRFRRRHAARTRAEGDRARAT